MTDGPFVDVVAAVIVDAGEYLVCRRVQGRGGLWEFPGGKVEPGEAHDVALRREIFEELGIGIDVGAPITSVSEPTLKIRLTSFGAVLKGNRPTVSTDHDRLEWTRLDGLREYDWAPLDVPTVDLLLS